MPQTDIASQDWSYDGVNAPAPSVAGMPNSIDSMAPPAAGKTLPPKTGGDLISGGSDIYAGGADLYRQHLKDETEQDSKTDRLIAQDRERLDKAQAQEAHAPQDIHDWNEEAQKEKYAAKPLQSFGSLGVIFATLASAFTHQPMINALNGSATAMNAIKDGKDEEYKRAFDAWKENTELAVKRQQMQHQTYEDAFKLLDTDITLGAIKSKEAAQRFGDQQMLFFIDNGMWDEADKLKANRLKYAEGVSELAEKTDDYHMRGWAYQQNYDKLTPEQKQDPNVVMNLWNNTHGIGKTNADQQQLVNWMLSHPMPPGDDQEALGKWFKDYTAFGQSLKTVRAGSPGGRLEQQLYENLEAARTANDPEAVTKAEQEINDYHKVTSKNQSSDAILSDDAVDTMAEQYMAGDKSVLQNLGRGQQAAQNIVKVREAVIKKAKEEGLKGADLAMRMAEFSATTAAQRAIGGREANVELFANEAQKMIGVAKKASADVPRTQWIPANKALQAFEQNTGDPKIRAFGASLNALINTYAKAIAGGGQATVSDKDHAREIITSADSQAQFDAVMDVINQEMQAAREAPGAVKKELRNEAAGGKLDEPMAPAQNVIKYDSDGNRIQ